MTAIDLHRHLQEAGPAPVLLDVREEWEYDICRLPESVLVPMARVPQVLDRLDRQQEIAVICHHGIRSRVVADFLVRHGFERVINLAGGVAAWARDVDPTMPVY